MTECFLLFLRQGILDLHERSPLLRSAKNAFLYGERLGDRTLGSS